MLSTFPRHADLPASWLRTWQGLRWWPFALAATISIGLSFTAPLGRKPFQVEWELSWAAIEFSVVKEPHIGAAAIVALLAIFATGRRRGWLALVLAVLVGAGWELGQTTVIGHTARLTDLLPDTLGAAFGCAWGWAVMWLMERAAPESGP
jgi:hypothetical protein